MTGLNIAGVSPTIDASGLSGSAVEFVDGETSDARLEGFNITGGTGWLQSTSEAYTCGSGITCYNYYNTYCGGGVAASGSSPTLVDLKITANLLPPASTSTSGNVTTYTYSEGGGLCFLDSSSSANGLTVAANYADQGGGIYLDKDSSILVTQSQIAQNAATDGGGIEANSGTLTMVNAVTAWNTASNQGGGVLSNAGTLFETNVVHAGDNALTGGGLELYGATTSNLRSIIVYAVQNGYGLNVDATATTSITFSDVYGNTPGNYNGFTDPTGTSGDLSVAPLFTAVTADGDWTNDEWTLNASSPVIDQGDDDPALNDRDATRNDMGAYGGPGGGW